MQDAGIGRSGTVYQSRLKFEPDIMVVKKRRNNSEKQLRSSIWFFQLENGKRRT